MLKERKVIIVEGQIDCLKMIEAGLNLTVAALGTAFGESHAEELKKLHIRQAYLLFDGDEAGRTAASKVGDLLQKKGIDVRVVTLPKGSDPDSFLTQFGTQQLIDALESSEDYLTFQVSYLGQELNMMAPAGKAEVVKMVKGQIEQWEDSVMAHESLKKLASLVHLPEEMVGIKEPHFAYTIKRQGSLLHEAIDTNKILELDLIRWLILKADLLPTARHYLTEKHFHTDGCKKIFLNLLEEGEADLLSLASVVEESEIMDEILQKKVNTERADTLFLETVQKLLDRDWMQTRESIRMEINSGKHSDEKIFELAKQFDNLKSNRPLAQLIKS
jgi:DNA primase